jgi:DNA-binding response OmpR family regulator
VVVVVEDDPGTLGLLADVAEDAGWVARTCRTLRQLERALDDVEPSLIILDDDLPDGSGGDQARRLRSDPERQGLSVVLCTGAPPSRLAEIGRAVPVVTKPFSLTEIERVLDAAMRRHRLRVARGAAG